MAMAAQTANTATVMLICRAKASATPSSAEWDSVSPK